MVQKRPSGFYFRWVFPSVIRAVLKQSEFVKSLKTKNRAEAFIRAKPCFKMVANLKCILEGYCMGEVTQEQFEQIVKEIWEKAKSAPLFPARHPNEADKKVAHAKSKVEEVAAAFRNSTNYDGGFRPPVFPQYQDDAASRLNIPFYETDDSYEYSVPLEVQNKVDSLALELLQATKHYYQRVIDTYSVLGSGSIKDAATTPPVQESKLAGMTLSELFTEFLAHKVKVENLSAKIESGYHRFMDEIYYVIGDKDLLEYARRDFVGYYSEALLFPKMNLSPYKGKSLEVIHSELDAEDIPTEHRISKKYIGERRKFLQGLFKFARDREYLSNTLDLSLPFKAGRITDTRWGFYSDYEMNALLEGVEKGAEQYWLLYLAAYTGMRSGEICQLVKTDIRTDPEQNIDYILVSDSNNRSLKSNAAKRKVPIHSRLKQLGFLDFVGGCENELFKQLTSHKVSKWFPTYRDGLGIPPVNENGNRKVFHSFRHTFVTKSSSKGITQQLIAAVVGHEVGMTITDRYTHLDELKPLVSVVESIDYGEF